MNNKECLNMIKIINDCLQKNLWMDFEICRMNEGQIILSGRIDEIEEELIEISFNQPFMISCLMNFSYEDGDFISLLEGEEAVAMNKRYNVEKGNHIFKLFINDNETDFFIIAKEINVNVVK